MNTKTLRKKWSNEVIVYGNIQEVMNGDLGKRSLGQWKQMVRGLPF